MIRKHSLTIRGHRTSISIEDAFWRVIGEIAAARDIPLARLITEIDANCAPETNLSSALRVFALEQVLKDREAGRSPRP